MKLPGAIARHRNVAVVALVVTGIAAAVALTLVLSSGGDSAGPSGPATTMAADSPAAELVRLLDNSTVVNFDVVYTVADPVRGASTAHLWRRPPLARLDSESGTGADARASAALVTSSGPVACDRRGTAPWTCAAQPGLTLANLGVVPPALLAQLSGLDVSVVDAEIGGNPVRCFTLAPRQEGAEAPPATAQDGAAATGELCITPDGIPAKVAAGPARIELVSLQRGRLPDSVFQPPAPVG